MKKTLCDIFCDNKNIKNWTFQEKSFKTLVTLSGNYIVFSQEISPPIFFRTKYRFEMKVRLSQIRKLSGWKKYKILDLISHYV